MKNRRHGVHNPNAMFRKAVTAEEVLGVAGGVRAAAPLDAVLAQRGRGRGGAATADGLGRRAAARPRCCGRTCPAACSPSPRRWRASTTPTSRRRRRSRRGDAYEAAGIGPDDLDVVECQDTDAARELLAYEELGLCAPGEQAALLADGAIALGGRCR